MEVANECQCLKIEATFYTAGKSKKVNGHKCVKCNSTFIKKSDPFNSIGEPELDGDGYPTEKTLETIKNYTGPFWELLDYIKQAWNYPERVIVTGDRYYFSTGGWSGNESLIAALQMNLIAYMMCFEHERRGGHYIFQAGP